MKGSLNKSKKTYLIVTTLIVGMCSIMYELLISTTSSYFLGNSIKQFSLIIGFYMAFMGVGAYLAKFITKDLLYNFIRVEIWLGLVGALGVPLIYAYFLYGDYDGFNFFVLALISIIGTLTGLEVPLITRILEEEISLSENISNILAFDYLGALVATIAFPFFLLPVVGVFKSSLIFGFLNILVGIITFIVFQHELSVSKKRRNLLFTSFFVLTALIATCLICSKSIMDRWNAGIFKHPVIHSQQSSYQDITVTKSDDEFRMYLNGAIQFSSKDEYRYHEALVHVPMMQHQNPKSILLLGGGEGLAAREILKYPSVEKIDLVDLDPAVTKISSEMALITELNEKSLFNEKVNVFNLDAFVFLLESKNQYDLIIADLPDPTSETLARLYSNAFYKLAIKRLTRDGILCTQATSSELTKNAFWCINETLLQSGFQHTYPYRINVPSFGNWGFIIAKQNPLDFKFDSSIQTRFLEEDSFNHIFYFPKDTRVRDIIPNNIDKPILMDYYLDHWRNLNHDAK